jgi:putative hydrolase of the HAD superfamily
MGYFSGKERPTVQDSIISVLAEEFPLSINELKSKIKHRYGLSVSYQAVHKEATQLFDRDILQRDGKLFLLSANWVQQKAEFYARAETNVMKRKLVTHIAFDLNDTLSPLRFDKMLWNEKIPVLFSRKYHLSLEEAKKRVYAEYYRALYIERVKNWTDIEMWFARLGLDDWKGLLDEMKQDVYLYDDVRSTIEALSRRYKLVVFANTEIKFIELKLEATGIRRYFTHLVSTTSTLKISEKRSEAYSQLLLRLKLKPEQLVCVGDDAHGDYEVPSNLGIRSFLLDRSGTVEGTHVIHSLTDLQHLL